MTRKEFIRFVCILAVGAFGFGNLIASLSKNAQQQGEATSGTQSGRGFGSSKFGA